MGTLRSKGRAMMENKEEDEKKIIESKRLVEQLPTEMIHDIFSRLPLHSLFRSRYVCKPWFNLVNDPNLFSICYARNPHPNSLIFLTESGFVILPDFETCHKAFKLTNIYFKSEISITASKFIGSINGFVCYLTSMAGFRHLIIWNPLSGDWIKLDTVYDCFHFYSFGYSPNTKEYKVMRISKGIHNPTAIVNILTLGNYIWRNIETVAGKVAWAKPGIFVNGYLYWPIIDENNFMVVSIKSFDIENETFGDISIPHSIKGKIKFSCRHLTFFQDCLVMFHSTYTSLDVWMMKDESWCLKYSISANIFDKYPREHFEDINISPIGVRKNGNVVLWKFNCAALLFSYDPEANTVEELKVIGLPKSDQAIAHMGSLLTLKDAIAMKEL